MPPNIPMSDAGMSSGPPAPMSPMAGQKALWGRTMGGMPLGAPPSPIGPMGPQDMSMMPPPLPDGLELYGNPVLDGPDMPIESLFPEETSEATSLDMMSMPMDTGMPGPGGMSMNPDQVRQAAQAALAGKAKARMGASQSFQSMATKMGQGF